MGAAMERALRARGMKCELTVTERAGDAYHLAARADADCVVAVGGDGTVNEIANALAIHDALLAILPLGSANVVARELRMPFHPEELADLIIRRSVREIDVGLHGTRRFLLGAGAGPDAAIVEAVHARRGQRLGKIAYVLPTLRVFWNYKYPKVHVRMDGEEVCDDGEYVIAGMCRYSAAVFPFTPKARIDDGLLDLCVMRRLNLPKMAWLAAAAWLPGFTRRRHVLYRQGREIEMTPVDGKRIPLQIDGDPAGALPATFRVQPRALRVIAPVPP